MKYLLAASVSTLLIVAHAAPAQERTLQLDINNLAFQARDSAGAPSAFGGTTHTGSLHVAFRPPHSEIVGVLMSTAGGPFVLQTGFTGELTDATVHLDFNAGNVTGGTMFFEIDGGPGAGGERYDAMIDATGSIQPFIGGGYQIDGLSSSGMFSSADWGGVGIADFYANQGGQFLIGSYLAFNIQPDPQGAGFGDIDVFVSNIPAPGVLGTLIAGGVLAMRRRRPA